MKDPATKLPMVTRKNYRDSWENKKADYEQQLSEALGGQAWTIAADANLLYTNCDREDMLDRLGDGVCWYMDAVMSNMKQWSNRYGAEGVTELNDIVPTHKLELRPQEETKFSYGGLIIKDGELKLVYADKAFVTNVDDVSNCEAIAEAIQTATLAGAPGAIKSALTVNSRQDIRKHWDPKISEIQKNIANLVNVPDIVLDPQFEQIAQSLRDAHKPKDKNDEVTMGRDLENGLGSIGTTVAEYYEALIHILKVERFGDDDMLQEGFQEAVQAKKVGLRTVQKLEKDSYCEAKIEDGVLWLHTMPSTWRVNVDNIARNLMELL